MRTIITNGFESLDGCLYRHDISTTILEDVLTHNKNRSLATLPRILPARTEIYVPKVQPKTEEIKQLWD